MRYYQPIATLAFVLPFTIVVGIDLLILARDSIHHLGDYSGMYSLGLGWLFGEPYVLFPWPLWGFGQLSAVMVWLIGYPQTDLGLFYGIWAVLNVAAVVLAGWLMACILQDLKLPFWSAFAFGLVGATMPMATTGWNHPNPYVSLGMLLIPGMAALLRVVVNGVQGPMRWYEWTALLAVGFSMANNFGAVILGVGAALAAFAARPAILKPTFRTSPSAAGPAWWLVAAYACLLSLLVVSLAVGAYRKSADPTVIPWWADLCALAIGFVVFHVVQRRLGILPNDLVLPVIAVLGGWLLGVNVLVLDYGYAGLVATGTISAPQDFSLPPLWPTVNWGILFEGTQWHNLTLMSYGLGLAMLLAGFAPIGAERRRLLRAGGALVLSIILLMAVITGWTIHFPVHHAPEMFGLNARYLWLGIAATAAGLYAVVHLFPRGWAAVLVLLVVAPVGAAGLLQSIESKRAIIDSLDRAVVATNRAIDTHLAESPDNLVLVANAYYPQRAQVLYAHHNSLIFLPPGSGDILSEQHIQYIGRYGSGLWRDPVVLSRERGLDPEQILIIAEAGDYPEEIEILETFPVAQVAIARLRLPESDGH